MVNVQEWLNQNYPKCWEVDNQKCICLRKKITELSIREKDLEGHLDLSDFINLRKFDCYNNQLTSIDLSGSNQLEWLNCCDNYLTNFDYSVLSPDKLTYLNISDNNLPEQDLSVFSRLINLELLWIGGNNKGHFALNIYNKFHGSLGSLKNLTKLKSLYIENTDIDSGLEYLPENVEIYLSGGNKERPGSKVRKIEEELRQIKNREDKIRSEITFITKGNLIEEIEKISFYHRPHNSLGVVIINRGGGYYAVRVVNYDSRNDEVTEVFAEESGIPFRWEKFEEKFKIIKEVFEENKELKKKELSDDEKVLIEYIKITATFKSIPFSEESLNNLKKNLSIDKGLKKSDYPQLGELIESNIILEENLINLDEKYKKLKQENERLKNRVIELEDKELERQLAQIQINK